MTLRKYPDDDCSENNLAWALLKNGQYEEALAYATKAVEADPTRTAHQDTLAHAAYGARKWNTAAEAWERAIALDPAFMSHRTDPDCQRDALLLKDAQRRAADSH
jgi:tetratricopeptide (TPR) repeat protein